MNEIFDKLIIRFFFAGILCLGLLLYRYLHNILYPSAAGKILKKIHPSKNHLETIHLFARLLAIALIFSQFNLNIDKGLLYGVLDFLILSLLSLLLLMASIYVIESISLYNFVYSDEIIKKKNTPYAIINFVQTISLAFIIRTVFMTSDGKIDLIILIWMFAIVMIGLASKGYQYYSRLSFNKLLIQKSTLIAYSYSGYIAGCTVLVCSSLVHATSDVKWYAIHTILKLILSLVILPIFQFVIVKIFRIHNERNEIEKLSIDEIEKFGDGFGLYEGGIFFSSCLLTSVIVDKIDFGNFYPILSY